MFVWLCFSADVYHLTSRKGNTIWDDRPGPGTLFDCVGTARLWNTLLCFQEVPHGCANHFVSWIFQIFIYGLLSEVNYFFAYQMQLQYDDIIVFKKNPHFLHGKVKQFYDSNIQSQEFQHIQFSVRQLLKKICQ